jgi:hypothetical protein
MDFYLLHIEFVLWDKCGTLAAPRVPGEQSALSYGSHFQLISFTQRKSALASPVSKEGEPREGR